MGSYSISLPLDDGFLRRECPHCERQFKWHYGPTELRPETEVDPDVYHCPYCGETATTESWWTPEQTEYAQGIIAGPTIQEIANELNKTFKKSQGLIDFKITTQGVPGPPSELHEPHDMVIIESPCHPWEPIKVQDDWTKPIHCIVCGSEFILG